MALIKCPECGKEISDKASTCPSCGCPIATNEPAVEKSDAGNSNSRSSDFNQVSGENSVL